MRAAWLGCALLGCAPSSGEWVDPDCAGNAAPRTIGDAVALLDPLPEPVTAACFVAALERPLRLEATASDFSAQPADSAARPRLFLFLGPLTVSVVPSGPGASLIEFGEHTDPAHTLKGELPLPVEGAVTAQDAFDHVAHPELVTTCHVCHQPAMPWPGGGYTSVAIRPEDDELVDVDALAAEVRACAPADSEACALLGTVFAGEVVHTPFPASYPTFDALFGSGRRAAGVPAVRGVR